MPLNCSSYWDQTYRPLNSDMNPYDTIFYADAAVMGVTCRQKLDCFLFPFAVRLESGKAAGSTAHISARHPVPSLPGRDPALLLLNYIIREELMMRTGDKGLPGMWQEVYAAR